MHPCPLSLRLRVFALFFFFRSLAVAAQRLDSWSAKEDGQFFGGDDAVGRQSANRLFAVACLGLSVFPLLPIQAAAGLRLRIGLIPRLDCLKAGKGVSG